jgi:hypothetical protein
MASSKTKVPSKSPWRLSIEGRRVHIHMHVTLTYTSVWKHVASEQRLIYIDVVLPSKLRLLSKADHKNTHYFGFLADI